MKLLLLALPVVCFSMLASAADNTVKPQSAATSTIQKTAAPDRQFDSRAAEETPDDHDLCYTMRVYMFETKDGEPPRPKGVKTCVASNRRILKKTDQPAARFKRLK